jgi:phytoene synthase
VTSLDAAELAAAYRYCRRLNAEHGRTFYLATALLPAQSRPAVHALYGFARFADDLVDRPDGADPPALRLARLRAEFADAMDGRRVRHPVVLALADVVRRYEIDPRYVLDFLDAMDSDLTVTRYADYAALRGYMWGSASVIGLQLLPVLGIVGDRDLAMQAADDLGVAFQLTNFIRDVGEDYRRGRVYLPQDSLAAHGVTDVMLGLTAGTPQVHALIAAEVDRARAVYRRAEPGIATLDPRSRDCVRTALVLYRGILDEVEKAGFEVLSARATVGPARRLRVGAAGYLRALRARRSAPTPPSTRG